MCLLCDCNLVSDQYHNPDELHLLTHSLPIYAYSQLKNQTVCDMLDCLVLLRSNILCTISVNTHCMTVF